MALCACDNSRSTQEYSTENQSASQQPIYMSVFEVADAFRRQASAGPLKEGACKESAGIEISMLDVDFGKDSITEEERNRRGEQASYAYVKNQQQGMIVIKNLASGDEYYAVGFGISRKLGLEAAVSLCIWKK